MNPLVIFADDHATTSSRHRRPLKPILDYPKTDFSLPRTSGQAMAASTHHRDYQLFISALRDARVRADVTQQELADRISNTQTFISKVERGERRLDLVETVEICEALAISPSAFINRYLEDRKALKQDRPLRRKLAKHPQ